MIVAPLTNRPNLLHIGKSQFRNKGFLTSISDTLQVASSGASRLLGEQVHFSRNTFLWSGTNRGVRNNTIYSPLRLINRVSFSSKIFFYCELFFFVFLENTIAIPIVLQVHPDPEVEDSTTARENVHRKKCESYRRS